MYDIVKISQTKFYSKITVTHKNEIKITTVYEVKYIYKYHDIIIANLV